MRFARQLCAVLLCTILLLALMPVSSLAASEKMDYGFSWSFDSATGTLTITGNGSMQDFESYKDRPWEAHEDNITKVVISKGITSVGEYAFYDLESLTEVVFPGGLRAINTGAFKYCDNLVTAQLPDTLISIGDQAFCGCDSYPVSIPNSVVSIGAGAFACYFSCNTEEEFHLPASVTSIGTNAFFDRRFSKITVDSSNSVYYTDAQGVLYGLPTAELIKAPATMQGSYSIADGTVVIRQDAFSHVDGLDEVVMPDSVTSVEPNAFSSCSISSATLSHNLECIPSWSFFGTDLVSLTIPDGVTTIESSAFTNIYSLKDVHIPASVTALEGAFDACSKDLSFTVDPNNPNYSNTPRGMLTDKAGKVLVLAAGTTNGTYVVSPEIEVIAEYAFLDSPFTSVAILGDSFSIGSSAFCSSNLKEIYIGKGLTHMDGSMYGNPFEACFQLKDIYYEGTKEQWEACLAEKMESISDNITIHYNVSYEEFRNITKIQPATLEPQSQPSRWAVIVAAAVLVPGVYLLVILLIRKRKKEAV